MTDQEIDKWVEDHVKVSPWETLDKYTRVVYPKLIPAVIEWGKIIAHKFYELGKQEGKKVVDYTAAFELEDRIRYEEQ